MNDKEFDLTMLENSDNETIKSIAENCPASDEEKERMFAMSRKIYNERTKESNNKENIEVSGVEQYRKPVWQKFAAIAAALVLTGSAVAGGIYLMKNKNQFKPVDPSPVMTSPATSPSTQPSTIAEEGCPFGDISNDKAKMSGSAYLPEVIEVAPDTLKSIADSFNKGKWTELAEAFTPEGDYVTLFIYNNGNPFQLDFYFYNSDEGKNVSIKYNDGKEMRYFTGDEVIKNAAQALGLTGAIDSTPTSFEEPYDDLIRKVWEKELSENSSAQTDAAEEVKVPPLENMHYELAKAQLKDLGLNCNIIKKSDNTVNPGYVIKTEPAEGTSIQKGIVINLYVSADEISDESDNVNTEVSAEDAELIAKAQQFYENAIETDLLFGRRATELFSINTDGTYIDDLLPTIGGYEIPNVSSISEIQAKYHETFSDRYSDNNDTVDKWYIEKNGKIYWIVYQPGVNLYLESTTVTKILRRTDDEIFFAVDRHYSDFRNIDIDGFDPYTETDEFSVVIQPDGSWKVGKFYDPMPN